MIARNFVRSRPFYTPVDAVSAVARRQRRALSRTAMGKRSPSEDSDGSRERRRRKQKRAKAKDDSDGEGRRRRKKEKRSRSRSRCVYRNPSRTGPASAGRPAERPKLPAPPGAACGALWLTEEASRERLLPVGRASSFATQVSKARAEGA